MEDRIKKFMDYKGISPSELADSIGVQRSNVSHVLKARNKPSFQFIERLLQVYPELNAKWLLLGEGKMIEGAVKPATLFDTLPDQVNPPVTNLKKEEPELNENIISPTTEQKEIKLPPPIQEKEYPENEIYTHINDSEKVIEKLIVIYKDQTFKIYNPSR